MAGRRRESNREELKMRIVDTAAKAFKRLGIKAVHMDDIAGSLSISKRTLYELIVRRQGTVVAGSIQLLSSVRQSRHARTYFQGGQRTGSGSYVL